MFAANFEHTGPKSLSYAQGMKSFKIDSGYDSSGGFWAADAKEMMPHSIQGEISVS